MPATEQTWTCPATVVHVHDGDTVVCDIDLGYHVSVRWAVRVDGLAAPELKTEAGKLARDYAEQLLPAGAPVTVVSKKLLGSFEKYGRVLADLAFAPPNAPRTVQGSFAIAMIAAGHAEAWDGRGKQPGT
jgi:endonuclease YncB( thermonuclease family)